MLTIDDVVGILERHSRGKVFFVDGQVARQDPNDGGWHIESVDDVWPEDGRRVTLREALEKAKQMSPSGV